MSRPALIDPIISPLLPPIRWELPLDPLFGLGLPPLIVGFALLTPPTPSWKLIRAAVFAPLAIVPYFYWGFFTLKADYILQWSVAAGCTYSSIRILELLVIYPAEEHVYRLVPAPGAAGLGDTPALLPEPIPPPWSWKKLCWAHALFQNNRGIGWNFTCDLPPSSRQAPFSRTSTRAHWIRNRTIHFIFTFLITDLARSWMNLGPYAGFFDGRPGLSPGYHQMRWYEKAINSLCIAVRVRWTLENVYFPAGLIMIGIGAITGWKGDCWEPWGWPPMFGRIDEVWAYPGFSNLWSRLWHQHYRRWLYVFGGLGIGEKILGLPHSGPSARPLPLQVNPKRDHKSPNGHASHANGNGKLSPSPATSAAVSGRSSPTHPLPSNPSASTSTSTQTRRSSPGMILSNFIKSLIVFCLCGWIHDNSCFHLLRLHYHAQGQVFKWTDAIVTLPFFLLQPFALAAEAIVKSQYRGWKRGIWAPGQEPSGIKFMERAVSFAVVWVWLGWTARWFVIGLTSIGMFRRDETQALAPSLVGGLIWGKWMH